MSVVAYNFVTVFHHININSKFEAKYIEMPAT